MLQSVALNQLVISRDFVRVNFVLLIPRDMNYRFELIIPELAELKKIL